jgi:hypothetical protein
MRRMHTFNRITSTVTLFMVSALIVIASPAFSQITELPFSQKVKNATDIFEGKVIRKSCFWNEQHSLIYTSNIIEIYKVFKGNIHSTEVEIITEGGMVDNEMQAASSTLELSENSIGVFMTEPSIVTNLKTKDSKTPAFKVYGSTQGFIIYDLSEKMAADPFKKYNNIKKDVYKAIKRETGLSYRVVKPFNISCSKSKRK